MLILTAQNAWVKRHGLVHAAINTAIDPHVFTVATQFHFFSPVGRSWSHSNNRIAGTVGHNSTHIDNP